MWRRESRQEGPGPLEVLAQRSVAKAVDEELAATEDLEQRLIVTVTIYDAPPASPASSVEEARPDRRRDRSGRRATSRHVARCPIFGAGEQLLDV